MPMVRVSNGGTISEMFLCLNTYSANQAYLMLPKSLLDNFDTIQLLASTAGTDFSSLPDSTLVTSRQVLPDGTGTAITLSTTPINISSISYTQYLMIVNTNDYQFRNMLVKLSN